MTEIYPLNEYLIDLPSQVYILIMNIMGTAPDETTLGEGGGQLPFGFPLLISLTLSRI